MTAKTQTSTFRLPTPLVEELRHEAQVEKINLNALVAKILANHVLWERYERKVGLLPMTKLFVRNAIEHLDRQQVIRLAKEIETEAFSNILRFMKGKYSVTDFIEILRSWLNVAWMQHNVERTEESYILKIHHDLGSNWSIYLETLIRELFHDIVCKPLKIHAKNGNLILEFPVE